MIKKFIIFLSAIIFTFNVNAASDGELTLRKDKPSEIKDCFEKINRATFAFNQVLDGVIFKPIAGVYKTLPTPIKSGVGNSLNNLKKAGINSGRFLINSTFGILGIFDVASHMNFPEYEKEDYGQSLARLGVGPGCYVVLPVLGPSTVRDASATLINVVGGDAWYNVTVKNDTQYFSDIDYYSAKLTSGIDFRAKNYESIDNLKQNSLDFYASVKSLYLQNRQQQILNVKTIVDTQDDSDWEEIEN
jgi:phospholipid-binding lipoprotein MlaA